MIQKYTMQWLNVSGVTCKIEIIDNEGTGSVVNTYLTPGSSPFVTSEDSSSDPMTPVRPQTGKLTFVTSNPFTIDLTSSHRWRVILKVSGIPKWLGWLKAEARSQSLWGVNDEVTLNVIDDLEALKTWNISENSGFGIDSLRNIISECFAHVSNVNRDGIEYYLKFSADILLSSSSSKFDILNSKISRYNFFSEETDSDGATTYNPCTCFDYVEKICMLFGWSLRIFGNIITFTYPGSVAYTTQISLSNFSAGNDISMSESTSTNNITGEDMCGMHTFDVEPGARELKINANVNKLSVGGSLPVLDPENSDIDWVSEDIFMNYVSNNPQGGTGFYSKWKCRYLKPKSDKVKLHRYYSTTTTLGSDRVVDEANVIEWNGPIQMNGNRIAEVRDNFSFIRFSGSHLVSDDTWKVDINGNPEEAKPNYNFSNRLILTQYIVAPTDSVVLRQFLNTDTNFRPMIEILGSSSALLKDGGIEISGIGHVPSQSGNHIHFNAHDGYLAYERNYLAGPYPAGGSIGSDDQSLGNLRMQLVLRCVMRIGNKYWYRNSSESFGWTTTPTAFNLYFDRQLAFQYPSVGVSKTLDMNFTCEKYAMPITGYGILSGDVSFKILSVWIYNPTGYHWAPDICFVKDLKIRYCAPTSITSLVDPPNNHEYTKINEGWTDDSRSIDVDIHSYDNDGASYSALINPSVSDYVSICWDNINNTSRRPEKATLKKYEAHYARSRKILKINAFNSQRLFTYNYIQVDGEKYAVLSRSNMNWRTNEAEFVLENIPTN